MVLQDSVHDSVAGLTARYLERGARSGIDPAAIGFFAALEQVAAVDVAVARSIVAELRDQRTNVKLIASENFCSLAVQAAQGNLFTDKYAEGYPGHRFYAGCDNVDDVERHAADLALQLFGASHAYVQPHSGADANMVAFLAVLAQRVESSILDRFQRKNVAALEVAEWRQLRDELHRQRLLGMDLYSGGHLTHGYRFNVSARLFETYSYSVDPTSHLLDLDALHAQLREVRPLILLAGYSAYSRRIDFARLREMADSVGAVLMVDMAHFAGLVAGGVFTGAYDPVPSAHIVTSTTHKTLRGPRGGLVLSSSEFADAVDKGCPAILGGPLAHIMAAKAVALREALRPSFRDYAARIVLNAQTLAEELQRRAVSVLTGGTDNHIVLANVASTFGMTGRQAEAALRSIGMTLNRNPLPFDVNGPWYTSGLRFGTAAVTTLGMGPDAIAELADIVATVLRGVEPARAEDGGPASKARYHLDEAVAGQARARVQELLHSYPLYPELDLDVLRGTEVDVPPEHGGVPMETV